MSSCAPPPTTGPSQRILVAGPPCPNAATCITNSSCSVVETAMSSDSQVKWTNVTYVGNLKLYQPQDLIISESNNLTLDDVVLPNTLISFSVADSPNLRRLSNNISWPRSIKQLHFTGNGLTSLPKGLPTWPLDEFAAGDNTISAIDGANFPPAVSIDLRGNLYVALEHVDLTYIKSGLFGDLLSSIRNVMFGPSLTKFFCQKCTITQFDLSETSFANLAKFPKAQIQFQSVILSQRCQVGGTLSQLYNYSSCVYPDSYFKPQMFEMATTLAPTTTLTPAVQESSSSSTTYIIIGVVAGALAIFALGFFFWRRQQNLQDHYSKPPEEEITMDTTHPAHAKLQTSFKRTWSSIINLEFISMQTTMIEHLDWADLEDFRVETTNIQRHKLLGKGGFGQVWLGTYNGDYVAIKLLTDTPMKTVHE
ncbi:hypothetical protein Ae201684P_015703 [Aphanomyces euteiches]|nr:hypothetical protein Ae201684P_015703 [Aphanomyces euteiches]